MNNYDNTRPDPDELLASIKLEEGQSKRGKLKIFFGMCAGVGKTFSMLESAHIDKSNGKDIVKGILKLITDLILMSL
jgi:two-component system sensor histidine kinase KdpD